MKPTLETTCVVRALQSAVLALDVQKLDARRFQAVRTSDLVRTSLPMSKPRLSKFEVLEAIAQRPWLDLVKTPQT